MYKKAQPIIMRTITSLHAGTGAGTGTVDLPIQRERHTNFPKVESSGLKGSLRETLTALGKSKSGQTKVDYFVNLQLLFGFDEQSLRELELLNSVEQRFNQNTEFMGSLAFSDARLLLFPVRSAKDVYAWITSPLVLERFCNDLLIAGSSEEKDVEDLGLDPLEEGVCRTARADDSSVVIDDRVILEEYAFHTEENQALSEDFFSALQRFSGLPLEQLERKLVVLSDSDFSDFVSLSTEVITRTNISPVTGTVREGQLFTEEYLPPESILYALAMGSPIFQPENGEKGKFGAESSEEEAGKVLDFFADQLGDSVIQLGGNATIGKGFVKTSMINMD